MIQYIQLKSLISTLLFSFALVTFGLIRSCDKTEINEDPSQEIPVTHYKIDTLVKGLRNPWGIAFLPDGSLLFTERGGKLYFMSSPSSIPEEIIGMPAVASSGQGGLLDVKPHPDFENNRWIYITYAAREGNGAVTRMGRGKLVGLSLTSYEVIFSSIPVVSSSIHFGSRIVFDDEGFVYCGIGDRGRSDEAQNISNHLGTVVRMKEDGSPALDNPFSGNVNAAPHLYAFGIRNPQGMDIHPETREIWMHEHGPRGGDEINILRPGHNYGWPEVSHGVNYNGTPVGSGDSSRPGFTDPVHHWTPSIAPCGMAFYNGNVFPNWKNHLFVGALAGQHISRLEFNGSILVKETKHLNGFARFRAITTGPDGYLYFLTESPGLLCRLVPEI